MIKALTKNRITHTEDADILNIAREFYNGLYTSQEPSLSDIDAYLDQIRLPALTEDRQNLCDHAISLVECEVALGNMKPNKSPGDDGLPMEFYKTFWKDIGDLLVEVYNDCFERKELPLSMRKAVITLIPKKGDKTDIENYRPISLTNTDYRILAGVLATRLQKVISDLIGPEQVAYIKGRFIGTNIRLIQDIFQLYNEKNYPGLFMFVDFQKAFDSIEWDFLFKVLGKYGFGNNFKEWIQLLYTKPCAYVKNNGFFSEEFFLTRGVRQGCQVSSLLFILCMEVLACHIRQNDGIRGLNIDKDRKHFLKIVQYADDATLFLRNSKEMREAIESIKLFGNAAGTKLNVTKCEGLWIGASKHRQHNCNLCNIKWPTEPIKSLGIYIGHDIQKCNKMNFDDKIRTIDDVITQAEKRTLTLFGKVCIIKSLAISKISYIAMCLHIPEKIIKEIDQRIFKFLWGSRDRIKRKAIINKVENGGLSMIDLRSHICALKAAWTCRIINSPDNHIWSFFYSKAISITIWRRLFHC